MNYQLKTKLLEKDLNSFSVLELEKLLKKSKNFQGPIIWLKFLIAQKFGNYKKTHLAPSTIFDNEKIKRIITKNEDRDYLVVETFNQNQNEYCIHKLTGSSDTFRGNLLLREIIIVLWLKQVLKNSPEIVIDGYKILLPHLKRVYVNSQIFGLEMSKSKGVSLNQLKSREKINIYTILLKYHNIVNEIILLHSPNISTAFAKLNSASLITTALFYCFTLILKDKTNWKLYLKQLFEIFNEIKSIKKELVFSHRDLYGDNILVDKIHKTITILDWQLTFFAPREAECANIIATAHDDLSMKKTLLTKFNPPNYLFTYFLLQKLTGNYFPDKERQEALELLKMT